MYTKEDLEKLDKAHLIDLFLKKQSENYRTTNKKRKQLQDNKLRAIKRTKNTIRKGIEDIKNSLFIEDRTITPRKLIEATGLSKNTIYKYRGEFGY